jgi:hypothetical protein
MTAYLLLDALDHREAIVVSDALDLPELSRARTRITSDDRLVVVSRDPERAWGSVTVNAWLRASRAVFVVTPAAALTFDALRAIPERRKPMVMRPPDGKPGHARSHIEKLDLTHVGADWRPAQSHTDARPTCVLCGNRICAGALLSAGDLRAHIRCRDLGSGDLARLTAMPTSGSIEEPTSRSKVALYAVRSLHRLVAGGYLTASEVDGVTMYKRAKAQVGG